MEQIKKQITDLLWSHATKAHGAGSCGELGDSFMAIDADSFSDIADELLQNFEPKSGSFTLDDMRKAFEGGRDSIEAELKCERYGDMDFYASKKIVKSFKTFIHENYR